VSYFPLRRSALMVVALAAFAACLAPTVVFAQSLRVTPVVRDSQVLVSFEVADAFSDELWDAIHSGLPTSFTYDVELRRSTPMWVDRVIGTARVAATVRFDNLTRRYQVALLQDGRVEQARALEDRDEVLEALTVFQRLPLFGTRRLEPNAEYYVRVQVRTRPRNARFPLPWDRDGVFGSATFTFLPQ